MKVNLDTIKPWINQKITEFLGFEDDVVIEFIYNQLTDKVVMRFQQKQNYCQKLFQDFAMK